MARVPPSSGDRKSYTQEWIHKESVSSRRRNAEDPLSAAASAANSLDANSIVVYGRVVDSFGYLNAYNVRFERGIPSMPCVLATATGLLPVGSRQANTLVPGTFVWVLLHPGRKTYGVILAVDPPSSSDGTLAFSDHAHMASRCGLRVDKVHSTVLSLTGSGGMQDWSAGRPFDGLAIGEWGAINETGLRVYLDSAMAQVAVDESTGLFAFYADQLTRLCGHNLQVSGSFHEAEWLDDQGEGHVYKGVSPYPWEHLGVFDAATDPFRDLTDVQAQVETPYYAMVEPADDDRMSFHRCLELGGYVGQGGRRQVLVPPAGATSYRYGTGAAPVGVFEEQVSLTGRYTLRSAKGVFIVKQSAIPGPKRVKRVEDAAGDDPANYLSAGVGNGSSAPAHKVAGEVAASDPQQRLAGLLDTVSYVCNWEGVHPLHYHANDWLLPEASTLTPDAAVSFGDLAGAQYLDAPPAVAVRVDHRYGDVNFYQNLSYFGLADDGGVAIGDGFGAEIRMSGGSVFVTAPGDVWVKSGRNFNVWSGFDTTVRAKNSLDLSATNKDVRVKAGGNAQLVAGVSGTGAVLVESQSKSAAYDYHDKVGEDVVTGGIHLKSASGEIAAWASSVYLRSLNGGSVVLDADSGKGDVVSYGNDHLRYVGGTSSDHFGTGGNVSSSNTYASGATLLGGTLSVSGGVDVDGTATVRGNLELAGGQVTAPGTGTRSLDKLNAKADAVQAAEKAAVKSGGDSWRATFAQFWYGQDRPGNGDTIAAVGFSFRNDDQYRTAGFKVYEDRWQQMAAGASTGVWTEQPVVSGSTTTYPYPGAKAWKDSDSLLTQPLSVYDQANGHAKDRDDPAYAKAKLADPVAKKPDGNYAVII